MSSPRLSSRPAQPRCRLHQPRIVLADDHPGILDAIGLLLKDVGEVVERVQDGLALVEAVDRLKPDIVITDLAMPGLNGLQATRILRRSVPGSKIIILTVHRSAVYVSLAIDAGASGYVLKLSAASELSQAVLHVLAGDGYIGQGVGNSQPEAIAQRKALDRSSHRPGTGPSAEAAITVRNPNRSPVLE